MLPVIHLLLTVCTVSNPTNCKEEVLQTDGFLMTCNLQGQQIAAEWINSHPKWKVVKYRCEIPRDDQAI